jgi:biopolymer transport protein ExbB
MESFSFVEMWEAMGLLARMVVFVLGFMSIYSLYVTVDRLLTFSRARRRSLEFVGGLARALKAQDVGGALALAGAAPQPPIARVVAAALDEYTRGLEALRNPGPRDLGDFDLVDVVHRSIERVKEREVAELKRGLGALASIASAAPFVGLFGTVVGIITAFRSMASSGQGGLAAVSGGIAEALVVTAFGLLVAIPAVLVFNHLTGRVEDFVVDMNDVSAELINFILKEGRPGGPR